MTRKKFLFHILLLVFTSQSSSCTTFHKKPPHQDSLTKKFQDDTGCKKSNLRITKIKNYTLTESVASYLVSGCEAAKLYKCKNNECALDLQQPEMLFASDMWSQTYTNCIDRPVPKESKFTFGTRINILRTYGH